MIEVWDKREGAFAAEDEAILVQLASIAANGFEIAGLVGSLREQDRRKDAFLAMLAQELHTPLAPLAAAMATLDAARSSSNARGSRSAPSSMRRWRRRSRWSRSAVMFWRWSRTPARRP